jgi:pimeloyl-ACP methyl ester carboxylesterase
MKPIPKTVGSFRSFDDTRIYYEVRGEGAPIIFVYGIGCLMNHWVHQTKAFSSEFNVILFDYRAHHNSGTPEDPANLSVEAMAQDLVELMDHLKLAQAHFVGHSFGVQVLIKLYQMAPQRFLTATFINGFVKNPLAGMFGNDLALQFFENVKAGYSRLPETLSALWRSSVLNPLSVRMSGWLGGFNLNLTALKDVEIYARGVASMDLKSFIWLFDQMLAYDGSEVLPTIKIPVLVIAGKKDFVTPVKIQEGMHNAIVGSEFLIVPYGSHCTQLDMPDLVNLKIHQFLLENTT